MKKVWNVECEFNIYFIVNNKKMKKGESVVYFIVNNKKMKKGERRSFFFMLRYFRIV